MSSLHAREAFADFEESGLENPLPGLAPSRPAPAGGADELRRRIVRVASAEMRRWGDGTRKETQRAMIPTLQDYWRTGVRRNYSTAQLASRSFQSDHPWSAAFVSWVMKQAGAGAAFRYAAAHWVYTCEARRNRERGIANRFRAYRLNEYAPQPGDVICKRRAGASAGYDNICHGHKTHGDIVVGVRPGMLDVIGGNVDHSVKHRTVRTDARGFITQPGFFAVLAVDGGAPTPGTPAMAATASARWSRAVRLNKRYGQRLHWLDRIDDIVRLLGFTDQTPDPIRFAQALAAWQRRQGLADDGILGPRTWQRMQPKLAPVTSSVPSGLPDRLATLVFRRDGRMVFRYEFTGEDLLWTARLISGEAGARDDRENRAVITAMFNRYALFTHRVYPTFSRFIRAYSTPLQPVLHNKNVARHYMNDARFVRLGGTYPGTDIPRGQLRRHIDLQKTPWQRLRPLARKIALEALTGRMPDTGIGLASEFASTWMLYGRRVGARKRTQAGWLEFTRNFKRAKGWRWIGHRANLNQKRNAFFIDPRAVNLPADAVQLIPPD